MRFMRISSSSRGPAGRRLSTARPGNHRRVPIYDSAPADEPTSADPLARDAKLARLEAVLFLADEPVPAKRLAEAAALADAAEVHRLAKRLREFYETDRSPFQIADIAGGYQLLTRPEFHPWLLRLRRTGYDLRLTPAGLETLAVIAYKQPIVRAEIDAVRGVQCGEVVRLLMEKGLVRIAGRHPSLGRPQLYGTTKRFLQAFGLDSLGDLPEVESLHRPR